MNPVDKWAAAIQSANGTNSGNIAQNYARTGSFDASPAQITGNQAQSQATIDNIKQQNAQNVAKVQAQKAQDASDPSKAQMTLLPNNQGYAFYNGAGQRININDFSLLTGKTPAQILSNSPNPEDQKFVEDYSTLQAFTNAWVNGDKKTLSQLRAADPQKYNSIISTYKSPADMVKAFTQHWSDYYGTQGNQTASTPSFGPQNLNQPSSSQAAQLATTSLGQVLTPMTKTQAPPAPNFLQKINPFSSQNQAVNSYQDYLKQNPWYAYQSSLAGS